MEKEIWKEVPGYEGIYEVSNKGFVKSLCRKIEYNNGYRFVKEKKMSLFKNRTGYYKVNLAKNGIYKTFEVHTIVAMSFLNHKGNNNNNNMVVDHLNGITTDNRLENLEIVTQRENVTRAYKRIKTYSKYVGVTLYKKTGKWGAAIKIKNKLKHLGTFDNEYSAALAYQKALKEL